jgi:hypothetical protein
MCIFSKYKNIFGEVGKGVHSYRFLNTALVDYSLTILGAILLTYLTDIPLVITTIGLLVLGLILHYLFGVNTNSLKYLGITC